MEHPRKVAGIVEHPQSPYLYEDSTVYVPRSTFVTMEYIYIYRLLMVDHAWISRGQFIASYTNAYSDK